MNKNNVLCSILLHIIIMAIPAYGQSKYSIQEPVPLRHGFEFGKCSTQSGFGSIVNLPALRDPTVGKSIVIILITSGRVFISPDGAMRNSSVIFLGPPQYADGKQFNTLYASKVRTPGDILLNLTIMSPDGPATVQGWSVTACQFNN